MRNKSTRQKGANNRTRKLAKTFKAQNKKVSFKPFSERISNINVDTFHKVSPNYESQTKEYCHFNQAIQKWNRLNFTEGYENFKKEVVVENYSTLPQLLLAKEHVLKVLLKHLQEKNPLYLQPILEIVVAVAQDLQEEFYPYYQQFLVSLIDLLNTKDTEQLEWVFTCLAYFFKFLWRPIIKNINDVLNLLLPLFSNSKSEYIKLFAAESFAFVARKVTDKEAFLGLLIKKAEKMTDGVSACGKLLFEVLKGPNGEFHNCAKQFLPLFFQFLFNQGTYRSLFFEILKKIMENIALHIEPQKSVFLWIVLLKIISNLEHFYKSGPNTKIVANIRLAFKLLGLAINYRNGKLLQNSTPVIRQLVNILNSNSLPADLQEIQLYLLKQLHNNVLFSSPL